MKANVTLDTFRALRACIQMPLDIANVLKNNAGLFFSGADFDYSQLPVDIRTTVDLARGCLMDASDHVEKLIACLEDTLESKKEWEESTNAK